MRTCANEAYLLFEHTLADLREVKVLSFTERAEELLREWRKMRIKGTTHDMRIAASCVAKSATLVTRNRRDFQDIPGLSVEIWD
jgi:tRNA(fMet)-specific endonuclease VapC